ncbi:MAG TPA: GntR family transcriptional regulator [Planctomycetaceae bacterium]|nr:GntR family transcriptional regulator [Planctomycetaceae bacterium]
MQINASSHIPIFLQIVEGVQSSIAAGIFRPGEALPSVRVLAMELQVNPNTVQRAFEELERLGVVESRRGVGKFVSGRGPQSALDQSEGAVRDAFRRGVALARAADLPAKRIRRLFHDALSVAPDDARTRP